ncbi:helix-turn-helix transcriptional regulator [Mucilaginibacter mali]|uniref:Helix-turn-helix transcriptional regulator n=1 Tax=Mucilaginibacter mali TaxID=2740462 RepID=A0A7D4U9M9_9SPHI|nr:AraC family transcriptional regulator [Mucilaginibacter mali]QKJ29198.1 helix-turn-helix transcriptional regulator [Mucilaginibacter mali]
MKTNIIREITPLTQSDCFTLFSRQKKQFDFPLHYHDEYELNLIINAEGAKRIIGNHIDKITDLELVFVGPNLHHGWFNHECKSENIKEVTIQFHNDLFSDSLLRKNQLSFIRGMLERSQLGILFSRDTIEMMAPRIIALTKKTGFDSVLELISILHDLSTSRNTLTLSDAHNNIDAINYNSRRIQKVFEYLNENYGQMISLAEVSQLINMPEVSFSRFIKKKTGKTFVDSLNDIRIGHASRMLINSTDTIAEIAFKCGFNNMSNFNRLFKRRKNTTPKDFRENYSGTRVFI